MSQEIKIADRIVKILNPHLLEIVVQVDQCPQTKILSVNEESGTVYIRVKAGEPFPLTNRLTKFAKPGTVVKHTRIGSEVTVVRETEDGLLVVTPKGVKLILKYEHVEDWEIVKVP